MGTKLNREDSEEQKHESLSVEAEKTEEQFETDAENRKLVYFWMGAKEGRVANFIPEIKNQQGQIVSPEKSVEFKEHIRPTGDLKEIEYIRNSRSFKAGVIKEFKTIEECQRATAMLEARKAGVSKIEASDMSKVVINTK